MCDFVLTFFYQQSSFLNLVTMTMSLIHIVWIVIPNKKDKHDYQREDDSPDIKNLRTLKIEPKRVWFHGVVWLYEFK